ncbi:MAG: extracellular solute-binding protein [Thermoleophilaceae bacterium]|nr:extracellular solute-binding protein [Thermoleophilaceae bacterium]
MTNDPQGSRAAAGPERASEKKNGVSRRVFIGRSAGVALAVGGLGSFLAACGGSSGGGKREVVVMAWENYVDPEIQKRFQNATGIRMRGIAAESDQDMFTKLKAGGGAQYDVVFANCGFSPLYYKNGLIEAIDLSEIPASKNLWPVFKENTDFPYVVEKNKTMLYPSMWASFGIVWNSEKIDIPAPYSWNELWNPKIPKGKVIFQGAGDDFLSIAGLALGVPRDRIYSMTGAELQRAADYLAKLKPFQISKSSDQVTADAIRTGKAWAGQATSLGLAYRINEAAGKEVARIELPKEGALGWVDGPQLVKGAKNRENALKFIDFLCGDPDMQDWLWKQNRFGMASKTTSERILSAGDADSKVYASLGGDRPQIAEKLVFQGPPDNPKEWTAVYDKVIAG